VGAEKEPESDYLKDLSVNGRIIQKWIFRKQDLMP
jgi:hypothetical protein